MLAALGERLGQSLPVVLIWEFPTPHGLSQHLANQTQAPHVDVTGAAGPASQHEPIAIVGIACRFPQAESPAAFWRLLRDGRDAIVEIPQDRWDRERFYSDDPAASGKMLTRHGAFLPRVDLFDPHFFHISPREAAQMDPQQRLALELSWEALEDAGIVPGLLRGQRVGLFMGAIWNDWAGLSTNAPQRITHHTGTGGALNLIANRVSYVLGLQGPSMVIDSACSSSLVAVHLACRSLLWGDAALALAGGVNLMLSPQTMIALSKFGGLARDGRCKAFSAGADGFGRGEGGGIIVLKRYSQALLDGDRIYCLLRGSAVNNDGLSNGLTAPNPQAQESVLREAYARAGIEPARAHYVEAHGAGTLLGDPIEAKALGTVLGAQREGAEPLYIGSVKTNIGHQEGAAGIAGIIKTALAIHHRTVPPSLHCDPPNPHIPFDTLRLAVPRAPLPWPALDGMARAGVSSFGWGGTNCHVVLAAAAAEPCAMVALAAPDTEQLLAEAAALQAQLAAAAADASLAALCAGAGASGVTGACRLAFTARSRHELDHRLAAVRAGRLEGGWQGLHRDAGRLAFVFSPQGGQWHGMGRELLAQEPVFRACLEQCDQVFQPLSGWSLIAALGRSEPGARDAEADVVQPLLVAVQIALAALLRDWGVTPDLVVGHSMGEVSAAHVAGILSLRDSMFIIHHYSRLQARLADAGGMAVVELSEAEAEALIQGEARLCIAACNGPRSTVLSGETQALDEVLRRLQTAGGMGTRVRVNVAAHSPQMQPILDELGELLKDIRPQQGSVPMWSTLTGEVMAEGAGDALYWPRNLRERVRLAQVVKALALAQCSVFMEISPHPILTYAIEQGIRDLGAASVALPTLRRAEPERRELLQQLCQLFVRGRDIDRARIHALGATEKATPASLPFLISGHSEAALRAQARALLAHLEARPELTLADVAWSLGLTRTHFERRAVVVAGDAQLLRQALVAVAEARPHPAVVEGVARISGRLAFVFPGQGSQWEGMARALLANSPVFRDALAECERALTPLVHWSLFDVLAGGGSAPSLDRVDVVQPVLFAVMVALAAVWRSLGVEPDAVVGHSQGEVAAAHVAGALSLEDAAKVVALRSKALLRLEGEGAMAAVELPASEAESWLARFGSQLSVAAINSPTSTLISGAAQAVEALLAQLAAAEIFARRVKVSYASHSAQVESIREELLRDLQDIRPTAAAIPLYSSVTLERLHGPELDADYWYRNLRQPVRFAQAVERLLQQEHRFFIEVSPHPVLTLALRSLLESAGPGLVIPTLRREEGGWERMLLSLGELHVHGRELDLNRILPRAARIELPTYAFQRERLWLEPSAQRPDEPEETQAVRPAEAGAHPLLGARFRMSTTAEVELWEPRLSTQALPWLAGHRVEQSIVFPAAAYIEMSLASCDAVLSSGAVVLEQFDFKQALVLAESAPAHVQVSLAAEGAFCWRWQISQALPAPSGHGTEWHELASARIALDEKGAEPAASLDQARTRCDREVPVSAAYERLAASGLHYGPPFRGVQALFCSSAGGQALGRVELPPAAGAAESYRFHPALLDACLQVALATVSEAPEAGPLVPVHIAKLRLAKAPAGGVLYCEAVRQREDASGVEVDLTLWDASGQLVGTVIGLHAAPLGGKSRAEQDPLAQALLGVRWEEAQVPGRAVSAPTAGRWLVLADGQGVGAAVGKLLEGRGAQVELVAAAAVDPSDPLAVARVVERSLRGAEPLRGILIMWGLDAPEIASLVSDHLLQTGQRSWAGALHAAQAVASQPLRDPPRLVLVTWRSQAPAGTAGGAGAVRPEQALLWGLGATLRSEQARLRPLRVDLGDPHSQHELSALVAYALSPSGEDQVALREERCYVARLTRQVALPAASPRYRHESASDRPYRLELDLSSAPHSLRLTAFERSAPGAGQVEIAAYAAGVNFLDVLSALGEIPPPAGGQRWLGGELAGCITRVGPGVELLHPGQRVLAVAESAFATHVSAPAQLVCAIPEGLDFEQAATLPIAYLTVCYALSHVARLQKGERILIHSAAGGVGLAAVHWARHCGAEIFATAGSEEKRAWLREQGIRCVSDSRSDVFVEQIGRGTEGRGVDVVLNALSGPLREKSFGLLAEGGRFIELGKRDYLANRALGLRPFLRGLSYSLVDLAALLRQNPRRVGELLHEVMAQVQSGVLPPLPHRTFPLSGAAEAFWELGRGQHIGKFVLTTREPVAPQLAIAVPPGAMPIKREATYLVTGGLGGLGLCLARLLARQGAAHLLLIGRSGVSTETQRQAVAELQGLGTEITVAAADVADAAQLAALLAALPADRPLRGVVHAAGLLDDALLPEQSVQRFHTVMAPKVAGAWNLHQLTRDRELDFFVLYSSVAALLGTPGQGNYAAANAFLDALAHHRKGLGLPALSLGWGPFADVGLAAAQENRGARLAGRGMRLLSPAEGGQLFERLLHSEQTQVAPCPFDAQKWVEFYPEAASSPFLQPLLGEQRDQDADAASRGWLAELRARPLAAAREQLAEHVGKQLALVLRRDPRELHADAPFRALGLDSLMGLELRNRLQASTGLALPATTVWTYATPAALTEHLAVSLGLGAAAEPPRSEAAPGQAAVAAPAVASAVPAEAPTSRPPAAAEVAAPGDAIAIIGLGCRFPGGDTPEAFWDSLVHGRDLVREIPDERLLAPWPAGAPRWAGLLDDVAHFNPLFFGISPKEALSLDPQQRLLLEVCWEALERAQIVPARLLGSRTGVFVGLCNSDYLQRVRLRPAADQDRYDATGNMGSTAAGRIAYTLGLKGPALTVDTACSSSLVAVHLACQSLQSGESELAMAGGVNLILCEETSAWLARTQALSPDGRCRTFDAAANGYVRGEGCGMVVLKRLADALRDRDSILAVIQASVVNQDGRSTGLTAPNVLSQQELLREALRRARIEPQAVSFIECHGTGTALGDPIEIDAQRAVYGAAGEAASPLWLGAVKTQIGHLEAAAGVAGLIKTVLALQHRRLPANLHLMHLNPRLRIEGTRLRPLTAATDWTAVAGRWLAGVSAFGLSGTNAHLILEAAPAAQAAPQESPGESLPLPLVPLLLSGRSPEALRGQAEKLRAYLLEHPELALADLAFALATTRTHFEDRAVVWAQDREVLLRALAALAADRPDAALWRGEAESAALPGAVGVAATRAYLAGQTPDWSALGSFARGRRVALPTYAFLRQRYWLTPALKQPSDLLKKSNMSEATSSVGLELDENGIALIRITDRSGKNQFSAALLQDLAARLKDVAADPAAKVIVLTGYDDVFCLGGSQDELKKLAAGELRFSEVPPVYRLLLECPLPVIAAMQGHALGAGLAFGLFADIVVMSEDHMYSANFMNYGITPGFGATLIFKEKLSERIAGEMLWTGREFSGKRLKEQGATMLFEPGARVVKKALELARAMAEKPLRALKQYKRAQAAPILERLPQAIALELRMHEEVFSGQEASAQIEQHFSSVATYARSGVEATEPAQSPAAAPMPLHRRAEVQQWLLERVASELHMKSEELLPKQKFIDLGIDSVSIINLVRDLNAAFALELQASQVYDYPSIHSLTDFVCEQLRDRGRGEAPEASPGMKPPAAPPPPSRPVEAPKALRPLKLKSTASPAAPVEPAAAPIAIRDLDVAIIGMSGRFPDAPDLATFWRNLEQGVDSVREVPGERWRIEEHFDPTPGVGKTYSKWGGFLSDIDKFDPLFFNISPLEAQHMDPQQRLFLEESFRALEDAGYSPASLRDQSCGVFAGAESGDYEQLLRAAGAGLGAFGYTGTAPSLLAARIAYFLDLTGPNLAVGTACSSSLVAIHLACQSLRSGECKVALAGGVHVMTTPSTHIISSQVGGLSPRGRCRSFDDGADGFVLAEGVAVVVLKPLRQALADGDAIHAVIRGSGVNQDGSTNGIMAPSARSQAQLLRDVYKTHGIDPAAISYVEAHGTGTKLGDPIEVRALAEVFQTAAGRSSPCALGSVKSNLGHPVTAAGVAGLLKTVLCLAHRKLVPSLHFEAPNREIDFGSGLFAVNTRLRDWTVAGSATRLAAVSSFGVSGTNAHLVVQEAPPQPQVQRTRKPCYLVPLSARTQEALVRRVGALAGWLSENPDTELEDLSYTLGAGRAHFEWRVALVVESVTALRDALRSLKAQGQGLGSCAASGQSQDAASRERLAQVMAALREDPLDARLCKQRLEALARLYLEGHELPWELLHAGEARRRLHLPTYPFAGQRYWVSSRPAEERRPPKLQLRPSKEAAREPAPPPSPSTISREEQVSRPAPVALPAESRASAPAARPEVQRVLNSLFQDLLFLEEPPDEHREFINYGVDSVIGLELINRLNAHWGLRLSPAKLYDHPTLARLARHLGELGVGQSAAPQAVDAAPAAPATTPAPAAPPPPAERAEAAASPSQAQVLDEPVAIVGMAARLPQCADLDELWQNLAAGRSCVTEVPPERWSIERHYSPDPDAKDRSCSKWGGFLSDVGCFDPLFFDIAPAEARWIDPQQRLFLQVAWQALEDAGCTQSLDGTRCGVYAGVLHNDYAELIQDLHRRGQLDSIPHAYRGIGNNNAILSARVSYLLNLKGAAVTIDTACSSSLVAVHLACQALTRGEADLMLAGGVTLYLTENRYLEMSGAGMLSKTGACKSFDQSADGIVPGEGCAVLVLKRLRDALASGDRIHGIIRGSGINQDGRTNGITAPSAESQKELLLSIYRRFRIDPADISYVETHGTGTKLGDPIEVEALSGAFASFSDKKGFCALGSLKSNLGHTSAAAGAASLIKTLLCMRHKQLVPSLHFHKPNEHIDFAHSPFYVNTLLQDWKQPGPGPRLAAVSAFGISGTNAHVVIEEGPAYQVSASQRKSLYLLTLSAKHPDALKQRIADLARHLRSSPSLPIEALAYTLNARRSHFAHRLAMVAGSIPELLSALDQLQRGRKPSRGYLSPETPAQEHGPLFERIAELLMQDLIMPQQSAAKYEKSLLALADLYSRGYDLDWEQLHRGEEKRRIAIPSYPFLKELHWVRPNVRTPPPPLPPSGGPSSPGGHRLQSSTPKELVFETEVTDAPAWNQHQVEGRSVVAGACFLAWAIEAAAQSGAEGSAYLFEEVMFERPLIVDPAASLILQTVLRTESPGRFQFEVRSASPSSAKKQPVLFATHARGRLRVLHSEESAPELASRPLGAWQQRCTQAVPLAKFEQRMEQLHLTLGSDFKWVREIQLGSGEALGSLAAPASQTFAELRVHPGLLDSCLRLLCMALPDLVSGTFVPVRIDRLELLPDRLRGARFACHVERSEGGTERELAGNICILDAEARPAAILRGLHARKLGSELPGDSVVEAKTDSLPELYRIGWIPQALLPAQRVAQGAGCTWIFAEDEAAATRLKQELAASGALVAVAILGTTYSARAELSYIVDPYEPEHFHHLLDEVTPRPIQRIIYLGARPRSLGASSEGPFDSSVAALLHLVQAADQAGLRLPLFIVTTGSQAVEASELCGIEQSLLWGFARSAQLEHPQLALRSIDLDPAAPASQVLAQLRDELEQPESEPEVAYRSGQRYVLRLTAHRPSPSARSLTIDPRATYLVTGALGALGQKVASWLADKGARHLTLVSRRAAGAAEAEFLQTLAKNGCQVDHLQCDISDEKQAAVMFQRLEDSGRPLKGVIHSAGVLADELIARQSWQDFARVLAPKLAGGWNLHAHTKRLSLDFFVLFSSAVALLGNIGQAHYAAANAYLDALAHYRRGLGLPALSMDWGAWENGMAASADRSQWQSRGIEPLPSQRALRLLDEVLLGAEPQVAILNLHWGRFASGILTRRLAHFLIGVLPQQSLVAQKAPAPQSVTEVVGEIVDDIGDGDVEQRRELVFSHLRKQLTGVLELAPNFTLAPALRLSSLGMNSLLAIELKSRIGSELGVSLPIEEILGQSNIGQLVDFILAQLPQPRRDTSRERTQASESIAAPDAIKSEHKLPQIVPAQEDRYKPFPLAEIQQAYWIGRSIGIELSDVGSHAYVELDNDELDLPRLTAAWNNLIRRHDLLRMEILPTGEQHILETVPEYRIACEDLRHLGQTQRARRLEELRQSLSHRVFDATRWPLFEIQAARIDDRKHRIFFGMDLLIVDFMGLFRLFGEWARFYHDPGCELPALTLTFRDYVLAEIALRETELYQRSVRYWFAKLDRLPPAPRLPMVKKVSEVSAYRFTRRQSEMDTPKWQALVQRAREHGLTPSGVLLAAFAEILTVWCDSPEFTVNLTQYHRLPLHPEMNEFLGNSTAILLLAVDNSKKESFVVRAQRLQKQLLQDLDHLYVNGVTVLRELARRRQSAQEALMPVVFTSILGMSRFGLDWTVLKEIGTVAYSITQTPQVWLDHQVLEVAGGIRFHWDAVEELFPAAMLDDMFAAYCRFLSSLADSDDIWQVTERSLVPTEQLRVFQKVNATRKPVSDELLHTLFLRHAQRQPERPAILSSRRTLSHAELYRRANQIGRALRELGARPNKLVAIVMQKGWEQIVAAYGILFSGAAYLPIDPELPAQRVRHLLADGEVEIVLTQPHLKDRLDLPVGLVKLCIGDGSVDDDFAHTDASPLQFVQSRDDLAYVLYTSGSTGLPKGVAVPHGGPVNTLLDINRRLEVEPSDRVLGLSELNFDLSVYDVFGVLGAGGAIVLPDAAQKKDPGHVAQCLREHQVTLWNSVPLLLQMLVAHLRAQPQEAPAQLQKIILSGDVIPPGLPIEVRSLWPNLGLLASAGGPTETSIWNIYYAIDKVAPGQARIPYGKPLSNCTYYVLNEHLEQRPVWATGELCAGGICLARGYWKAPDKTAEKFVAHPVTGERLYKTGDLGRSLPDGTIEILGRIDFQVKVNGYRVELQEIEAVLAQHPQIRQAAVDYYQDPEGRRRLVAYCVTGSQSDALDEAGVRGHLAAKLPDYMVPVLFMKVAALPLSPNGKLNRAALPRPQSLPQPGQKEERVPQSEAESRVADIVGQVLRGDGVASAGLDIGMQQSLFELGANSLHIVKIHAQLEKSFGKKVPVVELFKRPTVRALARYFGDGEDAVLDGAKLEQQAKRQRDFLSRQRERSKTHRS